MQLSEHVYCVDVAFKMTEWAEQWICIQFCIKVQHSSRETIQMIQKDTAMGNWWLAVTTWQCARSRITSPAEIFGETLNDPGDSAPLQPRCGALQVLAFSKTKITFEREEISDHQWDWGKYNEAVDGNWENCVRSQCAYLEGDWSAVVLCTMFLVSCLFFSKCLYFSCYMAGYLLDRPCIPKIIESRVLEKCLYTHHIQTSISHDSQKMEATQGSINR